MAEFLLLKWGTIKGWDNFSDKSQEIVTRFYAADKPDEKRRKILCELIDQLDGEIQNDWTGEMLTKEQAKEYVLTYGQR